MNTCRICVSFLWKDTNAFAGCGAPIAPVSDTQSYSNHTDAAAHLKQVKRSLTKYNNTVMFSNYLVPYETETCGKISS